jgi:hypothetical protein
MPELHGGNREAYGTVALGRAFDRSLARRPNEHEMITRLERIGEPWQRKPGPRIPSRLTGRIIMASLYGVWGRLAAGLDRADLIELRVRPIGVRKPVLRGSMAVVRHGCGGGRKCAAVGASDDHGRAASHRGAGETTAVGDLAAVPDGCATSPAILVSALTAAPAAGPS